MPTAIETQPETNYYLLSVEELEVCLNTHKTEGLKDEVIDGLQELQGPNALEGGGGVSVLGILAGQVFNAMVLVLILAFCVSLGIQSWIESGVIAGVIIANVAVGFFQFVSYGLARPEYSSAKTMSSLRSLASPTAHVIRSGNSITIPSKQVCVGDLVVLKTGDVIPADIRLVEAFNFEADEALLTGESVPVAKNANKTWSKEEGEDVGIGDRINMAYSSSVVTKGRATGIVIAIGMDTQIGAIARSLGGSDTKVRRVRRNDDGHARFQNYLSAWALTAKDQLLAFLGVNIGTPLQRTLSKLAILLFFVAVLFAIIVFSANSWKTDKEITLYAVATGLCMIPASLVVVLTVTLAGGTRAMAARNVIVRKLDSLEALGAVTDICSDKTGTLTQGKMVVRAAYLPGRGTLKVAENNEPADPTLTSLTFAKNEPESASLPLTIDEFKGFVGVESLLNISSLCNLATVTRTEAGWKTRGDPTESAIQVFAHRFSWGRETLTTGEAPHWSQVAEFPFDSDVKRMSVIFVRNSDEKKFVFSKGAVERMMDTCTTVATPGGEVPLDKAQEAELLENVDVLAEQGLRVLALATRNWTGDDSPERGAVEHGMTLIGLVGLYDPPRPETRGAVRSCHNAGIQVHMLTGDQAGTARAIAIQVGILPKNMGLFSKENTDNMVTTASRFDKLSDADIDAMPMLPLVIARCSPQTKVRMVEALHRRKAFCAMTGDGVNDAPSLKRSDIGIAMGLNGSDVAKESRRGQSDLVLADDKFSSIVNAVEEGRRIADNLSKFVLHLLAQNVIQAIVLLVGLSFKDVNGFSVFPLAPIEILWVIMITSGFPAMGVGALTAASDIMRRKPRMNGVFVPELLLDMAVYGVFGAALCLATFVLVVYGFNDGDLGIDSNNTEGDGSINVFRARSATFSLLTWISLLLAFEVIDMRRSFFNRVPDSPYRFTQWAHDIWMHPLLFWSCMFGFFTVFPIVYIPGLNTTVFKHSPISWEWSLVFIGSVIFLMVAESWKWAKRVYIRHRLHAAGVQTEEEEAVLPVFKEWRTLSFSKNNTLA